MRASVIIRSKDEAYRLRLTLCSLAVQTEKPEVVVVNDGSTDDTAKVIEEAMREMEIIPIHHARPAGRSAAANAGAAKASGDIVLFLDGDTLAAPDLVARHMDKHRQSPDYIVRGETWSLRCTRPFLNPETATPWPAQEEKVSKLSESERKRSSVTREQIRTDFKAVDSRGQPGIYQGFGPRKLYEIEMDALVAHPDSKILWLAAAGSNQSMNRAAFIESKGFHPEISINEHRELALRLCQRGLRMTNASGRTYHMLHRTGWRDPMQDLEWERIFYDAHPIPEVALLKFFWGSLSDPIPFPAEACIRTLPELEVAAERYRGIVGLNNVREAHLQATVGKTTANE